MVAGGLFLAAVVVALDQLSKWVIVAVVMQPPRVIPVAPFFDLVLHWNRGISFGLFNDAPEMSRWILVALALAISAVLVAWLRQTDRRLLVIAIGLVIGGAVGNVIDRVRFGAVVDFLSFHAAGYYWPAFNLADSAITVGVATILMDSLLTSPRWRK
jgi:signal peptidase II